MMGKFLNTSSEHLQSPHPFPDNFLVSSNAIMNHRRVLGVSDQATQEDIRAAYKALVPQTLL